jgi:flagellar hook-basal body complex protein FliE
MAGLAIGTAAALSAYRANAAPAGPGIAAEGDGFTAVLGRALENTVQSTRAADATSQRAMVGDVGATEVVMAVTRAELALQTVVALRDRMLAAYQEVMRMPI